MAKITAAGTLNGRPALRSEVLREQRVESEKIDAIVRLRNQGSAISDQQAYETLYNESLQGLTPGDGAGAGGDGAGSSGGSGAGAGGDGGSGTGGGDGGSGDGGTGDGGPGGPGGDGGNY